VESSTSSAGGRAPQPLAEARRSPINRIGAQTRTTVVNRIVVRDQLDVAPFASSI
jgi:hypothetical protein